MRRRIRFAGSMAQSGGSPWPAPREVRGSGPAAPGTRPVAALRRAAHTEGVAPGRCRTAPVKGQDKEAAAPGAAGGAPHPDGVSRDASAAR
ncbi:hypothetical protein SCWH03_31550 [Streptomyces pacificus]|uniref:Uncharacterized protein n=1 Tax=Streptomyces pacificus TaxID=2705029 RepID=A0A6A0AVP0_9ACTN|nr:hypothetical protein SCWH03_31550 [Streptomyces pacificus]